jgi:hypothetical protein
MVPPNRPLSVGGQHALLDMVELHMYLLAKPQQLPWPMLSRGGKDHHADREPHINPIEQGVAWELLDLQLIEATSSQTFVVSKSGYQYYEGQMKRFLA